MRSHDVGEGRSKVLHAEVDWSELAVGHDYDVAEVGIGNGEFTVGIEKGQIAFYAEWEPT